MRRRVEVVNAYGSHMRPSTRFVSLANTFRAEIAVIFEDRREQRHKEHRRTMDQALLAVRVAVDRP